jgi:protein FAM50
MTKSALLKEAETREQLRKEFLLKQEAVKATEIVLPFVFYDGTNIPGGMCKVRKGDPIWLFLDRSRKVGAELGSRREWARVGVDDLMLVRGEVIIPHHYDFYYFIVNRTLGTSSNVLFDYTAEADHVPARSETASPAPSEPPLAESVVRKPPKSSGVVTPIDSTLEGVNDDPNMTKVVDRRWYERNKHIFPANIWVEFDPTTDFTKRGRRDAEGNKFFFS